MPLAGDAYLQQGGQLPAGNNPLNRLQLGTFPTTIDPAQIIAQWTQFVEQYLFPIIEDLTGVDLSAFLPTIEAVFGALTTLFGDLNPTSGTFNPLDAVTTFINLMVEVGANLPMALIQELTGFTGGVPILSQLIGLFTGTTGGLTGLGGLGAIFGDLTGLLGNPTALGSGTPVLGSLSSIPILGPIFGLFGGASNATQATNFFTSITSLFGNPAGLLTGSPTVPALGSIPILGPIFGLFGGATNATQANNFFTSILSLFGNPTGVLTGTPTLGSLNSIPILGPLFSLFGGATSSTQAGNFFTNLLSGLGSPTGLTGSPGSFNPLTMGEQLINNVLNPTGLLASIEAIVQSLTGISGGSLNILGPLTGLFGPIIDLLDGTGSTTGASNFTDNGDGTGLFDFGSLGNLIDNGDGTAMSMSGLIESLTGLLGTFQATQTRQQGLVDAIFNALNFTNITGNYHDDSLQSALQNIPYLNVIGVNGPANIGDAVLAMLDSIVGGAVGAPGTGASNADAYSVFNQIGSNSALGGFAMQILGIRANKNLGSGFLPSSYSNLHFGTVTQGATATTVPVTRTTALMSYHRIQESMDLGAISWQGYGTTNITNAYVNIYKMNTSTGANDTLLHTSADIVGLLTGGTTPVPVIYSLPTPITGLQPGDVIGVEQIVRGTGTHNVAGQATWLQDQAVHPRRWSSVRDSSTTLSPTTITPAYTTSNVPFVEIAVTAGATAGTHSPTSEYFNIPGGTTWPIPSWANHLDVIVLGGGGGGHQGGTWGIGGAGGDNGAFAEATWDRGTHFTGGSVSITVGAAGTAGVGGSGGNGGTSTATITGYSVTAVGGAGATSFDVAGSAHAGQSPGTITYNSQPYVGGAVQNAYGAKGAAPGGGGSGGNWVSFQPGGAGAAGAVWIRAYQ